MCHECNGWGTRGEAPSAEFCDCRDGNEVRTHRQLRERYLALVNSGKVPAMQALQASDPGPHTLPPRPPNWPPALNPAGMPFRELAAMPPLWDGEES